MSVYPVVYLCSPFISMSMIMRISSEVKLSLSPGGAAGMIERFSILRKLLSSRFSSFLKYAPLIQSGICTRISCDSLNLLLLSGILCAFNYILNVYICKYHMVCIFINMPLRIVSQRSDLFDLLAANSETQLFAFLSGTTSGPQFLALLHA